MNDNKVAALRRCSLSGVHEGWGDDCYALVKPANYDDMIEIDNLRADKSGDEQTRWQIDFIQKKFYSGKIMKFDDKGDIVLADMTKDDVNCSTTVADKLFMSIIGVDIDPKALRSVAANVSAPTPSVENTETSSSTESPKTPQTVPTEN